MTHRLHIRGERASLVAELGSGPTAQSIVEASPFEARANLWGDEVYFRIPVSAALEGDASEIVEVGDVCYWPEGEALCIFFGPTPASRDDRPVAASAVTSLGRVTQGLEYIGSVSSGETLKVAVL